MSNEQKIDPYQQAYAEGMNRNRQTGHARTSPPATVKIDKQIDLTRAYTAAGSNDEAALEQLDAQIQLEKTRVADGESKLADLLQKEAIAKKIIEVTTQALAGGAFFGAGSARADQEKAEKVLAYCTEQIPRLEDQLRGAKGHLATLEERRKNFDMTGLRAKTALRDLLAQCHLPGH